MKKVIIVLVIAIIGAAGYYAYKRFLSTDDLVKSIPADAVFVVSIDPKSIVTKAGGKDIAELKMFKKMKEEMAKERDSASKSIMHLMDNATGSGLNVLNRFYFFMTTINDKPVFGVIGGLLSSTDFEKTLRAFPLKDSIITDGELKTLQLENEELLAWNSKQVILLGGTREGLGAKMKELFNHSTPSIASNSSFRKFDNKSMDLGLFLNYNSVFNMTNKSSRGQSPDLSGMYKDVYADFVTTFETNSIVTKTNYYFEDESVKDKLMIMSDKGLDPAHAKLISPRNVLACFTISARMDKFFGMFESMKEFAMGMTEIEKQIGLNHDEMKKLLNGNMSLALVDFSEEVVQKPDYQFDQKTGEMNVVMKEDTTMMPIFTATIGVNDWNAFNKVMKGTGLQKTGDYYVIPTPMVKIYMIETKTGITATNGKEIADAIASKKELAELSEPVKSLVGNSASMYLDLNVRNYPEQIRSTMKSMMGPDNYTAFENTMSMFKDVEMKAEGYSGTMEIKLNEGSDNSLHRMLVSIDNNIYPIVEKQNAEREERMRAYMEMDSIRAAESAQTPEQAAH